MLLASIYIGHAQKDLQNIAVRAISSKLKYNQQVSLFLKRLNKVEKEWSDYHRKVDIRNMNRLKKKEFRTVHRLMKRARVHMIKGNLEKAFKYLSSAEIWLKYLKR